MSNLNLRAEMESGQPVEKQVGAAEVQLGPSKQRMDYDEIRIGEEQEGFLELEISIG